MGCRGFPRTLHGVEGNKGLRDLTPQPEREGQNSKLQKSPEGISRPSAARLKECASVAVQLFDFLSLALFQKLRNFPKSQREHDDTSLSYI